MSVTDRGHLSIGEVLSLIQIEFPDVTISKIRFLESQGLIDPERTPSGYRKFYENDIDRLRWILVQQRDHFLPLKVIKDRIREAVALDQPLEAPPARSGSMAALAHEPIAPDDLRYFAVSDAAASLGVVSPRHVPSDQPSGLPSSVPAHTPYPLQQGVGTTTHAVGSLDVGLVPSADGDGDVDDDVRVVPAAGSAEDTSFGASLSPSEDAAVRASQAPAAVGPHGAGMVIVDETRPSGNSAEQALWSSASADGGAVAGAIPTEATPTDDSPADDSPADDSPADDSPTDDSPADVNAPDAMPGGANPADRAEGGADLDGDHAATAEPEPETATGEPTAGDGGAPVPSGTRLVASIDVSSVSFTAAELAAAVGTTPAAIEELERYGLITSKMLSHGRHYGDDAVIIARLAVRFGAFGIEARHLRMFKVAVDRELALYDQVVAPQARARGQRGEPRETEMWAELDQLGAHFRDALFHRRDS